MKSVTIYTSEGCPWCEKALEHLKKHNIEFTEVKCKDNKEAIQKLVEKSGQYGVPVLEIGEKQIIVGCDLDLINDELGLK